MQRRAADLRPGTEVDLWRSKSGVQRDR